MERAVAILSCFSPLAPRLTLTEISVRTGLDKVTVSRLLATLSACGLVRQEPATRAFVLTHRIVSLASAVPGTVDLQELVEPVLREVSRQTECLSFLSTPGPDGAICLARAMIDPPIRVQLWKVGESRPYNQGAAPRLLFAHLTETAREAVLARPLPQATPHTVACAGRLRADAEGMQGQMHFIARDDIVVGLSGAAHVIRDRDGGIMGAVSVSGLSPMFAGELGEQQIARLRAHCLELERQLAVSDIDWAGIRDDIWSMSAGMR